MPSLPLFVSRDNKYPVGLGMFAIGAAMYLGSNHFHLFEPRLLHLFWVDRSVPFVPETVWIYLSEYAFFAAVYIACRDLVELNKYLYSFIALQAVSCLIFVLWPTTFPRELYPLPAGLDRLTAHAFGSLRQTDTPANCCPSLHVSSVYLSTYLFLGHRRRLFPWFFVWGTGIALSTLTTKQHYLIDVIAGFGMSMLFYWVFHRLVTYRRVGYGLP